MTTTSQASANTPVIIGLDISTRVTGMCAINKKTGQLLKLTNIPTHSKKKFPTFWSKVESMKQAINDFHEPEWDVQMIAVEEPAKRFAPGLSSADTIITLAKFNGIVCYFMYAKYGLGPTYVNVRTARKVLGIKINYKDKSKTTKQKILDSVVLLNRDKNFPWIHSKTKKGHLAKVNEDMADAWVMAAAAKLLYS